MHGRHQLRQFESLIEASSLCGTLPQSFSFMAVFFSFLLSSFFFLHDQWGLPRVISRLSLLWLVVPERQGEFKSRYISDLSDGISCRRKKGAHGCSEKRQVNNTGSQLCLIPWRTPCFHWWWNHSPSHQKSFPSCPSHHRIPCIKIVSQYTRLTYSSTRTDYCTIMGTMMEVQMLTRSWTYATVFLAFLSTLHKFNGVKSKNVGRELLQDT